MNLNMELISKAVTLLIVVACIVFAWSLIVYGLFIPIRRKEAYLKELEDNKKELEAIQIQKGVEWDKYKEKSEELDKLRVAYLEAKKKNDELKEENIKLENHNSNLSDKNKILKDELKTVIKTNEKISKKIEATKAT